MHKFYVATTLFLFSIAIAVPSTLHAERKPDPKLVIVQKFFSLREQMLDQRGTDAQVDELLRLFSEKGHYEHPAAGISMDKSEARRGMHAHLREGSDAAMAVHQILIGPNFAVAEVTLQYRLPNKEGKLETVTRNGVTVFQFEGGQLTRVAEY